MATPAQITANRINSQKSTGPRSPEGKSKSRFNALKHGLDAKSVIIPGEDSAEFDTLAADYRAEFGPATPSQNFHVDTMIRADWNKRRFQPVEAELYRTIMSETPGGNMIAALLSGSPAAKLLARIQRQILAFERAWYRAHNQLQRARLAAQAAEDQAVEGFIGRACPTSPFHTLASFPENTSPRDFPPTPASRATNIPAADRLSNPALRL